MKTPGHRPLRLDGPADLQRLMGTPYELSEQQWAAVSAPLAPSVVVAGAGSGKTSLMAARVVYLVATGQVRPDQVLGLTFTTKATAELRGRIREALATAGLDRSVDGIEAGGAGDPGGTGGEQAEELLEPTVSTYNAYAAGLLTAHGLRIGHEPETRVIADASRFQLGARVVERHTGDVEMLSDHPPTVIGWLLALDGEMSEHLVDVEQVLAFDDAAREGFLAAVATEEAGKNRSTYTGPSRSGAAATLKRRELLDLVATYRRLKGELGVMDFADQIALAARLAEECPEVGALERDSYRVVLLDEYQDTSVAQARMLARLFGSGHPVTAVGDPNQAIYGWRGASVSNILRFPEQFSDPAEPAPVLPLTVNRRSDRHILDFANRLVEPLLEASDRVVALEPDPGAGEGRLEVEVFETSDDELAWLAAAVVDAHERHGAWSELAVLTRENARLADAFDALSEAGVPVEIVGLSGLLHLPEIAEVVATLELVHSVTANDALLTLLTGPRWAIGPRDLALLARRAADLAHDPRGRVAGATVAQTLDRLADGLDPAEDSCLLDALEDPGDPGDLGYSAEALVRFGLLAEELRRLRRAVGEPLLDLVRRIIEASGVEVELASTPGVAAAARRDNLDLFVKAVAEFQAIDGEVSLPALVAYLTAEDEEGNGLDVATPSEADSVKLLTFHRAKGLEWDACFCIGVCEGKLPNPVTRAKWYTSAPVLPTPLRGDADDLPQLDGFDKAAIDAHQQARKAHQLEEELRLGYVAFTRPRHELFVTSYLWGARKTSFGPSAYQETLREQLGEWGAPVGRWHDKPPKDAVNPMSERDLEVPWPAPGVGREITARRAAAALVRQADPEAPDQCETVDELALLGTWDAELDRLVAEARADRSGAVSVRLPAALSATALARLRADPEGFAADLVRPMPRPPSSAARFGVRFHDWVQRRFGQMQLLADDDIPGRGDLGIEDDAELRALVGAFEAGPFGERQPVAVEQPFSLVLAGQVVRGRIDAVYAEPGGGAHDFLVVDWKTHHTHSADPLQLALYRLAWAELHGVDPARVRAAFYYVRSDSLHEPSGLLDRPALEALIAGSAGLVG